MVVNKSENKEIAYSKNLLKKEKKKYVVREEFPSSPSAGHGSNAYHPILRRWRQGGPPAWGHSGLRSEYHVIVSTTYKIVS